MMINFGDLQNNIVSNVVLLIYKIYIMIDYDVWETNIIINYTVSV